MKIIASEISYLLPPFSSSNTWLQLFNILIIISFFQTILPSDFQFERDMLTSPTFLLCWLFSNLLWNTTFILINLSQLYSFVAVLFTFFKLCWIFFCEIFYHDVSYFCMWVIVYYFWEFEVSHIYKMNSRTSRETQRNPVLRKKKLFIFL